MTEQPGLLSFDPQTEVSSHDKLLASRYSHVRENSGEKILPGILLIGEEIPLLVRSGLRFIAAVFRSGVTHSS